MRHLLSPLDLSVDELARLLDLEETFQRIHQSTVMYVMERR